MRTNNELFLRISFACIYLSTKFLSTKSAAENYAILCTDKITPKEHRGELPVCISKMTVV